MIWTGVILEDSTAEDDTTIIEDAGLAEELSGKMRSDPDEERLAHSIMENDEQSIKDGKLLSESVDYAMGSFTPDLIFEKLVQNYKNAQRLFGPTIIRELTEYDGSYVEKNTKIAEFREEIRGNIAKNIERLKKEGLLDKEGVVTDTGYELASLVMYTEELDRLQTKGLGKKTVKEHSVYGEADSIVPFRKARYKDVDMRGSILRAIRRGHASVLAQDLRSVRRKEHGRISIIYALDASGSMRGQKISTSKKAGIALAYKAIQDGNDVGIIIFTSKIEQSIPPTRDFPMLLHELAHARAGQETDIGLAIEHAVAMFGRGNHTKHLIVISDALPTRGEDPGRITLEATSLAHDAGVTISVVGIGLEKEGEALAKRIVEISDGRLYRISARDEMGALILEDYASLGGNSS